LPDRLLEDIDPLQLEPIKNHTFAVQVEGMIIGQALIGGFKEVVGLGRIAEEMSITEGGFKGRYRYNRRFQEKNITLRKGFTVGQFFEEWFEMASNYTYGHPDYHRNVTIILLGQWKPNINYEARSWQLINAAPVEWNVSDLNAESDQIAIEELILSYQGLKPTKSIFSHKIGEAIGIFQ
jgi:phage tail-like protein